MAVCVLGLALLPWLSAALTALHIEAHSRDGHHERDFDAATPVALHGHHHQPGTPEHDHFFLTSATYAPLPAAFELAPLPAAILRDVVVAAPAPVRRSDTASGVGHDPPCAPRTVSILRI